MDIETILLVAALVFIVLFASLAGVVIPFMLQIDVCGNNPERDSD